MTDVRVKLIQTRFGTAQYCSAGAGRPVIVAHGSGGGHDQGLLIGRTLLAGCRVLAVSRFGYLQSDLPVEPSNRSQAEIYRVILDNEELESAWVMGISAGGPSALEFAIRYASRCQGLILLSAVSVPMLRRGISVHPLLKLMAGSDFFYDLITTVFRRRLLAMFGLSRAVAPRLTASDRDFANELFRTTRPVSRRIAGIVNDWNLAPIDEADLRRIDLPVLVIHARDDQLVPLENASYSAQTIPGAELVVLEDGGHLLFTRHRGVRETIQSFLGPGGSPLA